jgi:TRAP-type mannitol/chloroaromatic compound transport system permease small subunit
MTILGAMNAILRYLGKYIGTTLTSNAFLEGQWYLFSAVFLLGAGPVLIKERHVRVDVLFERLSSTNKIYIDIVGTILFLLPFCIFAIWSSWEFVFESWSLLEMSPDAGGLPRYPVKTLLPISFLLLGCNAIFYVQKRFIELKQLQNNVNDEYINNNFDEEK